MSEFTRILGAIEQGEPHAAERLAPEEAVCLLGAIQAGEGLVQAFFGGFAGIDGTADRCGGRYGRGKLSHEAAPWGVKRKNR